MLAFAQTGIKQKKPVFGGACRLCPWGAMAEVVQQAMKPYGYDVQICYNCNAAGLGPVYFGAVAIQFLRNA